MSSTSTATFGDLLRHLRRRAGLTQGELAARVGLSGAQLSRLEQNDRLPDLALIAESFTSALALHEEPHLLQHLLELAATARGERPPSAIRVTRTVQAAIQEKVVEEASGLPSAPTLLIGRERSLRALGKKLLEAPGRLVTLVGPPGVGKTRLALAVATQVQALFADGAHLVPLAAINEPERVLVALITHLGLSDNSPKPPVTILVEALRRKELLLVLDNFEQVSAAAPQVAQLLEQCAKLRILVTSREPLHLRSEQCFRTPALEPAAAVALFLERAQTLNPDFALTADSTVQVAQLCLQLDCLPLAIELAAARSELFSPGQLLQQLAHGRLDLLESGARDLPERQRTLRNALAWSYRLLNAPAQQLLRTLGVFVGGFSWESVQGVCGHSGATAETHLSTHLQTLVASNLLVQHESAEHRRYSLLETIRDYALEQATQHREIDALRSRHAGYFARWATQQVQQMVDHGLGVWWRPLEQEHANLRAALNWLLQTDGAAALRLAIVLHPFWEARGYQNEGSQWLQQALAGNPAPTLLRAQGLLKVGIFAQQRMELQAARQWLDEALTLFRTANDLVGVAESLRAWGWLASNMGDAGRARRLFEESLASFRALQNRAMVAMLLSDLVHILSFAAAPYEETHAYIEESLTIFRELGQGHGIALALRQRGVNETRVGHYAVAIAAYRDALTIWRQRGSEREIGWTLEMLGETYWLMGEVATAASHWVECLPLFQAMNEEFGSMILLHHLGQVERVGGRLELAADYYSRALNYFAKQESPYFVARTLAGLGGVALAQGETLRAAQLLGAAYRLFDELPPFLASADQADYARMVESARLSLGEVDFQRTWAAGRALSRVQSLQLAEQMVMGSR